MQIPLQGKYTELLRTRQCYRIIITSTFEESKSNFWVLKVRWDEQIEKEYMETIPFTIALKKSNTQE
jgi:hypothetical protein